MPAPWYARADREVERGFGEGEFERGGRPAGGYAQGGYETHMPAPEGYRSSYSRQGYGSYGGGAYRERSWRGEVRRVRDLMTPRAEVVDPDMTLQEAAQRMRADDLGAYPVARAGRLIGMVTDRDIVVRAVASDRRPSRTSVGDVMSPRIIYCFDDEDVEDVADLMARRQVRRIPVMNRDKRLVGMVALADLGAAAEAAGRRALRGVSERSGLSRR